MIHTIARLLLLFFSAAILGGKLFDLHYAARYEWPMADIVSAMLFILAVLSPFWGRR